MKTDIKTSKAAAPATRSHSQPAQLTRDERFWELYKLAFQGLHAQFEQLHPDGFLMHTEGTAELERSRTTARRAWNSARFACDLFEREEEVEKFNKKVA